jgi:hypothetical protein
MSSFYEIVELRNAMSVEETLLEKLRQLPPDKLRVAINFIEDLHKKSSVPNSKHSLKGLWADLGFDISEEDLRQVRREMWQNLPQEEG